MAVIAIDEKKSWVVAKWAVRFVLDRVNISELSQALAQRVIEAVDYDLGYLTLEGLPTEDCISFSIQVNNVADNLAKAGQNSLATPIIYDALLKSIRELQCLVKISDKNS